MPMIPYPDIFRFIIQYVPHEKSIKEGLVINALYNMCKKECLIVGHLPK
jgi:hypothetical protein